jgi:hypothetical protein
MNSATHVEIESMVFRKTNAHVGREVAIRPSNSATQHLAYGRIILHASKPAVSFFTGNRETGLIVLSGEGTVKVDD